jgi:RNA polymerase primary sigma factor
VFIGDPALTKAMFNHELEAYFRDLGHLPLLTVDQTNELGWKIINDGDEEAKKQLVRGNLRLVITIAKHYARPGVPLADLVSEGNLGLIRAVDGWDPARGARFSTYAAWWIKQAIRRRLADLAHLIHVPNYMIQILGRRQRLARRLHDDERPPEAIAKALGISVRTARGVKSALGVLRTHGHLGARDDDGPATDVPAASTPRPDAEVTRREELQCLRAVLEELGPRGAKVIRMRFGLAGTAPLTLDQVSRELGVTREAVRQTEVRALKLLRGRLTAIDNGLATNKPAALAS